MSNDAARHEVEDVLERVQEQLAGLATMRQKQAALTARASAADGTVEVTVDARGVVIKTVVDETYLEDFDFAELGGHITAAAQSAAQEVARRSAELLTPLNEQRKQLPSLSDIVDGAPDLRSLFDGLRSEAPAQQTPHTDSGGWEESTNYPTVRSRP